MLWFLIGAIVVSFFTMMLLESSSEVKDDVVGFACLVFIVSLVALGTYLVVSF